jgi:hypothetical protein
MSGIGTRFSDLIKQYSGEGDFSEWLKKLELVCRLQKIKELQTVLPLFLCGGAFAVYDGLTDAVKSDYALLTEALNQAFSANRFQAYEEFISRRLLPGESVDVYASDLRRLAKLIDPIVSDEWVKSSFVYGLPKDVQNQLKAACCLQDMELSKVLERARSLVTGGESSFGAAAQIKVPVDKREDLRACFVCNTQGHLARSCPKRKQKSAMKVICFRCGEEGHYANKCAQDPKNE